MNATTSPLATEKQFAFIKHLVNTRSFVENSDAQHMVLEARANWKTMTVSDASNLIDVLLGLPDKVGAADRAPVAREETPEGMHKFGGVIFKVQRAVHGSGKVYAKALVEDMAGGWHFEYVAGAIRNLSEATLLTLEEAKEFGVLYGTCCVCGRTLTNEDSIEAGIGPVCATKF